MNKIYYTIYKVTNKLNGKNYFGTHATMSLEDGYMGSSKSLKNEIKKIGIENFIKEILFIFDTAKGMFDKEAELVNENYLVEGNTYNKKIGGDIFGSLKKRERQRKLKSENRIWAENLGSERFSDNEVPQ